MILSLIAAILALLGISAVIIGIRAKSAGDSDVAAGAGLFKASGWVAIIISVIMIAFSSFYTQDAGEVVVLRSFTGDISGSTMETGMHAKAPWDDRIVFDTRNNVISFLGDGKTDYSGGSATGSHVTAADSGGSEVNIDIQVNYSLDPNFAVELYRDYKSQEAFVSAIAAVDTRSVTREAAGKYDTITLLTNRGELSQSIDKTLRNRWKKYGLNVEQVSVQQISYANKTITDKFAEAQAAKTDQERAKTEAETKAIEAEGTKKANDILSQSLSDNIIKQHYIDALEKIGQKGNTIVVPEGSSSILNLNK